MASLLALSLIIFAPSLSTSVNVLVPLMASTPSTVQSSGPQDQNDDDDFDDEGEVDEDIIIEDEMDSNDDEAADDQNP